MYLSNSIGPFCSICPRAKDRKTDWKCLQSLEYVCKHHSIKTSQITCKVKIITQTNFIRISFMNCIFLFSKFFGMSFYIGMKTLKIIDFLSLTESKKQTMKKKRVKKIIKK